MALGQNVPPNAEPRAAQARPPGTRSQPKCVLGNEDMYTENETKVIFNVGALVAIFMFCAGNLTKPKYIECLFAS